MKIGASMLATEDRTMEEALEYFSNKYDVHMYFEKHVLQKYQQ